MNATTRRGFLGGALAGAAAPALAGTAHGAAAPTVPKAQRPVVRRGRAIAVSADGRRVVVAHDQRTTIGVGASVIDVGGQPLAVAVSPDGRIAAVATAFWDAPGVVLVDLVAGKVGARRRAGPVPTAVAFTSDGRHLLVAGGEQAGELRVVDTRRWRTVVRARPGRVPRAIAALRWSTCAPAVSGARCRRPIFPTRSRCRPTAVACSSPMGTAPRSPSSSCATAAWFVTSLAGSPAPWPGRATVAGWSRSGASPPSPSSVPAVTTWCPHPAGSPSPAAATGR
jgi:hypothetical protein